MDRLPIDDALPALKAALAAGRNAVLTAAPGAGKTTRVPLALLGEAWLAGGKILMQEPRRLAARAAARRMASTLGEEVGATVGYRVRHDVRVGKATRIEVVTDGLFLRLLQADPSLDGVACVIFDELHERGLETDLALALTRESQTALRPDLRLLAMSATLDAGPVAQLLGDAASIASPGRMFPVSVRYLDREPDGRIEDAVATTTRRALSAEPGSALVFLPGVGEIRRVEERLRAADLGPDVELAPLYGDLTPAEQDRAIRPSPAGKRKVVLATSIAESSLTIEGVRIVVDSGLSRRPRYSPRTGMTTLETIRVSQAGAEQRRGRAGRLEPGVCCRLWTEPQQRALLPYPAPEIADADLAPLALELAAWGARDAGALAWLTPPPAAGMGQARSLLGDLGALDAEGAITAHGRRMAGFGAHPRLAHMLLRGAEEGSGALAAILAALVEERDILRPGPGRPRDPDVRHRVEIVAAALSGDRAGAARFAEGAAIDRGALQGALQSARQFARQLGVRGFADVRPADAGRLLALAYPDRIAQRRGGEGARYRLSGGRGAALDPADLLAAEEFLVIADLDAGREDGRVYLAAPIARGEIEETFAAALSERARVEWDARGEQVAARRRRALGALVLEDKPLPSPDPEAVRAAMFEGVRLMGLRALPWTDELQAWRSRVAFLRRTLGEPWPDLSDEALLATLDAWLGPHLDGASRRSHLARVELAAALKALLPWPLPRELDSLAPTHLEVPSGSRVPIDYAGAAPAVGVRLQEMFGLLETPRVARNVPVTLQLLSPARRPVQTTQDLASFWRTGYPQVKAELKGRYPRHHWPDDPLSATPTARIKPRS